MATKLLRYQHELAGLMTETLAIILQIYLTVHVQLNRIHSYLQKRTFSIFIIVKPWLHNIKL